MIASEKKHPNLSDYNQFFFSNKRLKVNKKLIFSGEKIWKSGNYSLVPRRRLLIQCAVLVYRSLRRHSNSSKAFEKIENKIEYICMITFEFAEFLKIMNPSDKTRLWRSLTTNFSASIKYRDVKFWHYLEPTLPFLLSKLFGIHIFYSLKTMRFSVA